MVNTDNLIEVEGYIRPFNSKGMWWLNYQFALEIRQVNDMAGNQYDIWCILRLDNGLWRDVCVFDDPEVCAQWIKLQFWQ